MHPDEEELVVERNIAVAARDMGEAIDDRIKRAIRDHATLTTPEAMGLLSLAAEVLAQAGSALYALVRASVDMKRDGVPVPAATPAKLHLPGAGMKCRHTWGPPNEDGRPVCTLCGKAKAANGRKPAAATVGGVTKLDPQTQPLPLAGVP